MRQWRADVRSCALYQKWNSSSSSPLESPAVFPASFYCPLSPPSYNLSLCRLPYFFVSPVFCLFPCLHYFSPPVPLSVRFVWLPLSSLLYLCFSLVFLHQYVSHSLRQLLSFCLLPVSLPVCGETGLQESPLSLSSLLSPGQAAVMVPNALLIPVTS